MADVAADVKALLDREKIRDCVARLARGEDRRDAALLTASFWPDSTFDYGVHSGAFPDYLAWVVPGSPAIPVTQHILGQTLIDLQDDRAKAETHVVSYHRVRNGEEERDTCIGGRYLDDMEARGGEWRVARRVMLYDWFQDFGPSVDWSQGVMGYPFAADHFPGRAVGDHSTSFFAEARSDSE